MSVVPHSNVCTSPKKTIVFYVAPNWESNNKIIKKVLVKRFLQHVDKMVVEGGKGGSALQGDINPVAYTLIKPLTNKIKSRIAENPRIYHYAQCLHIILTKGDRPFNFQSNKIPRQTTRTRVSACRRFLRRTLTQCLELDLMTCWGVRVAPLNIAGFSRMPRAAITPNSSNRFTV